MVRLLEIVRLSAILMCRSDLEFVLVVVVAVVDDEDDIFVVCNISFVYISNFPKIVLIKKNARTFSTLRGHDAPDSEPYIPSLRSLTKIEANLINVIYRMRRI